MILVLTRSVATDLVFLRNGRSEDHIQNLIGLVRHKRICSIVAEEDVGVRRVFYDCEFFAGLCSCDTYGRIFTHRTRYSNSAVSGNSGRSDLDLNVTNGVARLVVFNDRVAREVERAYDIDTTSVSGKFADEDTACGRVVGDAAAGHGEGVIIVNAAAARSGRVATDIAARHGERAIVIDATAGVG